jgi:hypothetical protein
VCADAEHAFSRLVFSARDLDDRGTYMPNRSGFDSLKNKLDRAKAHYAWITSLCLHVDSRDTTAPTGDRLRDLKLSRDFSAAAIVTHAHSSHYRRAEAISGNVRRPGYTFGDSSLCPDIKSEKA